MPQHLKFDFAAFYKATQHYRGHSRSQLEGSK